MTDMWKEIGGNNHPRWIADVVVAGETFTLFVFADVLSEDRGWIWQIDQEGVMVESGHEDDPEDAKNEAFAELTHVIMSSSLKGDS